MSKALVGELFPELEPRSVVAIEEGWDSLVLEVDREWIIRVPRRPEVRAWLEKEIRLLPELAPTLPVPIPRFEHVAENGVRAVAYRKLAGAAVDVSRPHLGAAIGRFLMALHAFPVDKGRDLGVPSHDLGWRERYGAFANELLQRVGPLLGDDRPTAEAVFEAYLSDRDNFAFSPCLIHSDLGPQHVLSADDELTGVIDWSGARIGDPAVDLAWVLHGTPAEFGAAALAGYGSADLRERALFFHRLGPWYEVLYGLDHNLPAFVTSGLAGIRSRLPRRIP